MKHTPFTNDEVSFLLYAESCLVDKNGNMEGHRMNQEDVEAAQKFNKMGLLKFERIPINELTNHNTHIVRFTEKAWGLAHNLRRLRAEKTMPTIVILSSEEKK